MFGSGFAKGKTLLFTCKAGFEMVGEKTIYCLQSGAWSDPPPRCISESKFLKVNYIHFPLGRSEKTEERNQSENKVKSGCLNFMMQREDYKNVVG